MCQISLGAYVRFQSVRVESRDSFYLDPVSFPLSARARTPPITKHPEIDPSSGSERSLACLNRRAGRYIPASSSSSSFHARLYDHDRANRTRLVHPSRKERNSLGCNRSNGPKTFVRDLVRYFQEGDGQSASIIAGMTFARLHGPPFRRLSRLLPRRDSPTPHG